MKATNILETIGNTPIVRINRLFADSGKEVWMKLERANPGGEHQRPHRPFDDRRCRTKRCFAQRQHHCGTYFGQHGHRLGIVAAVKGYRLILVMPESMSIERRRLMAVLWSRICAHAPRKRDERGHCQSARNCGHHTQHVDAPAIRQSRQHCRPLTKPRPKKFCKTSPKVSITSSPVLARADTSRLAANCSNSISPTSKSLPLNPTLSPVISGGAPGPHPIQGIGAGFVPTNLHTDILDGVIQVTKEEAFEYAQQVAQQEGIFVGISSGAVLGSRGQSITPSPRRQPYPYFLLRYGRAVLSIEGLFQEQA